MIYLVDGYIRVFVSDPKHQLQYQEFSNFLYPLNSGTSGQYCYQWWLRRCYPRADFKTNFIKLEALVMIGGPDDGVITPWQSRSANNYYKFCAIIIVMAMTVLFIFVCTIVILDFMMINW